MSYENVWVVIDSLSAYNLIQLDIPGSHTHGSLIRGIRSILVDDWNVEIRHSYHIANKCADNLANYAHRLPLGLSFFDRLSSYTSLDFLADQSGVSWSQVVSYVTFFGLSPLCLSKKNFSYQFSNFILVILNFFTLLYCTGDLLKVEIHLPIK